MRLISSFSSCLHKSQGCTEEHTAHTGCLAHTLASVDRCELALSDFLQSQSLCPNAFSFQTQARWTEHASHFLDQRTETQKHYTQVSHLNLQPQLPALALGFPKCVTPQNLWERNAWDVNVTWLEETRCLGLSLDHVSLPSQGDWRASCHLTCWEETPQPLRGGPSWFF